MFISVYNIRIIYISNFKSEVRAISLMEITSAVLMSSQMPDESRKQALSMAYIRAIAAKVGANIYRPENDCGVDLAFSKISERQGRYSDTSNAIVPFQLKSTTEWKINGDAIIYPLEAKNYNDLVTSTSLILIVMCLPPTMEQWLLQDEECLRLHKCCYYWRPAEDEVVTSNNRTKTIAIPRSQIFTSETLTMFLNREEKRLLP